MKLSLAPLHGVSGRVFRTVYLRHFTGFDEVVAPFIHATHVTSMKENHFRDIAPGPSSSAIPLVPQLLGNDAEAIAQTLRILADMGYTEVNWNLGCPFPMVAKKMRGSGLLPYPQRIESILDRVCADLPLSFSIKLRLGRNRSDEIEALFPILNSHPLSRLIIHPRLGIQMYKGEVDLDGFSRSLPLSRHPVGYNGDIRDIRTFTTLQERFPSVDTWMIGRWALFNPFLPAAIKGIPSPEDPLKALLSFHDDLYAAYADALSGPGHLLDKMKEIWTYIGVNVAGAEAALADIPRSKSPGEYRQIVDSVFSRGRWRAE